MQEIDQVIPILRMISEDLSEVSKALRSITGKRITEARRGIRSDGYPRLLFLRTRMEEAYLRRYEEAEQSWKDIKCCKNSFPKHDKVRGEVFCMNCGTVIVQRTFGQPGRKGGMWLGWK